MTNPEKAIEHEYTDEIVCPHCGHELSDSWEYQPDDGKLECDECNKDFLYYRYVDVQYVTKKADK